MNFKKKLSNEPPPHTHTLARTHISPDATLCRIGGTQGKKDERAGGGAGGAGLLADDGAPRKASDGGQVQLVVI